MNNVLSGMRRGPQKNVEIEGIAGNKVDLFLIFTLFLIDASLQKLLCAFFKKIFPC